MIRLRIEPQSSESFANGLVWYDNGIPIGRVIIEQTTVVSDGAHDVAIEWVPVEVVE